MVSWSLAILLVEWVLRVVMLVVVTRRRRPSSATTWLLIIFLEPIIGTVLFSLLANDRLPRRHPPTCAANRPIVGGIAAR